RCSGVGSNSSSGATAATEAGRGNPMSFLAPVQLGTVRLEHPIVMASMAGVTDLPCRLVARQFGAALSYSELVSAKALVYGNERSLRMIEVHPEERPVAVQIFGS